MTTLQEDVIGIICDDLYEVHKNMMEQAKELSTSELLARTIMGTADAIEKRYTLTSIGACESNGDPHYSTGIGLHYWGEVCERERSRVMETKEKINEGSPAESE